MIDLFIFKFSTCVYSKSVEVILWNFEKVTFEILIFCNGEGSDLNIKIYVLHARYIFFNFHDQLKFLNNFSILSMMYKN